MNKRFYNFKDRDQISPNLTRGGLRILATLTLVLLLVGADPAWSAQAAPASDSFTFILTAYPSANYVCVGETMTFRVALEVQLKPKVGDTQPRFTYVRAVTVNTLVLQGKGSITPEENVTGDRTTFPFDPNSVTFTFKAGNTPGVTKVGFKATFSDFFVHGGSPISLSKPVTEGAVASVDVRKCSYKVEMLFQEPVPGLGLLSGTAVEEELNQVSDKHYSGAIDFSLVYNLIPGLGCPFIAKIDPVVMEYSADLVGDQLYLNFSFPSLKATIKGTTCGDLPTTQTQSVETKPGSGTVKVSSKGGLGVLSTPYWTYLFIVTRESQ